jgi:O-acetyl-ADP-ribose deacetylase (regulator of RNase III)
MSNVKVLVGDLFASDAQTLVNTVNTVAIMGKGIALGFKQRFPEMFRDYQRRCALGEVNLGKPYLWAPAFDRWVLNFPTKDHWRSSAKRDDIVAGLEHLHRNYRGWGIQSLAVPPLGCGEGGLEWSVVGPTLYWHLARLAVPVELFAPYGTSPEELDAAFLAQEGERLQHGRQGRLKLSPGAVALAAIVADIDAEPRHWPIGRTMFQKLAYFATQAGIPTGLEFREESYGPFSPDLNRMRGRLEDNGVVREEPLPGGRMLVVRPGPEIDVARRAYASYLTQWSGAMERVADLFLRLNTREAEVAASVYHAALTLSADRSEAPSEWDVWRYIHHWKNDRLKPDDVASSIRNLAELGWLNVRHSPGLPVSEDQAIEEPTRV